MLDALLLNFKDSKRIRDQELADRSLLICLWAGTHNQSGSVSETNASVII